MIVCVCLCLHVFVCFVCVCCVFVLSFAVRRDRRGRLHLCLYRGLRHGCGQHDKLHGDCGADRSTDARPYCHTDCHANDCTYHGRAY